MVETVNQRRKIIDSTTPGGYLEGWWMSPRSVLPTRVRGCGSRNKSQHYWHLPAGASFSQGWGGDSTELEKSYRLPRPWMGTEQKVRGKAQPEPQVKVSSSVRSKAGAHVPGSAVCCRQGIGIPESTVPQNPLGSKCIPVQLLSCCMMQTCAVWDVTKSCSHSHPTAPCSQCGSVSLKCFTSVFYPE